MAIHVLVARQTREIAVLADRTSLLRLADAIANPPAVVALAVCRPEPYDSSLDRVVISAAEGRAVIKAADHELRLAGGPIYLQRLADEIADFAREGEIGDHVHIEYFEAHAFLDESSEAAVIELVAAT